MTVHTHLTPADVETRCAQTATSSTVAGLLDALRADSLWSVTEFSVGGQLVQADLLYHPSGEAFTMRVRRDLSNSERGDAE